MKERVLKTSVVDFSISGEFAKTRCFVFEKGGLCRFLEVEVKDYHCSQCKREGVALNRKLRSERPTLIRKGCDEVVVRILKNEDFFIGKLVHYTDGTNADDKKILCGFKYDGKKHVFTVMLKGEKDFKPFPFPVHLEYLIIEEIETENGKILRFSNDLGFGHSIDVYL